jgi:hypothetical protein
MILAEGFTNQQSPCGDILAIRFSGYIKDWRGRGSGAIGRRG